MTGRGGSKQATAEVVPARAAEQGGASKREPDGSPSSNASSCWSARSLPYLAIE